jgi:hypothetical protein
MDETGESLSETSTSEAQLCAECGATFPTENALVEHQAVAHHRISGPAAREEERRSEPPAWRSSEARNETGPGPGPMSEAGEWRARRDPMEAGDPSAESRGGEGPRPHRQPPPERIPPSPRHVRRGRLRRLPVPRTPIGGAGGRTDPVGPDSRTRTTQGSNRPPGSGTGGPRTGDRGPAPARTPTSRGVDHFGPGRGPVGPTPSLGRGRGRS